MNDEQEIDVDAEETLNDGALESDHIDVEIVSEGDAVQESERHEEEIEGATKENEGAVKESERQDEQGTASVDDEQGTEHDEELEGRDFSEEALRGGK